MSKTLAPELEFEGIVQDRPHEMGDDDNSNDHTI